jgi:hypothetical protein
MAIALQKEWFPNKNYSESKIREMYYPIIKQKEGYAPTIKTKLPFAHEKFNFSVFVKKEDEEVPEQVSNVLEYIKKSAQLIPVIKIRGLWVSALGFGPLIEMVQAQVYPSTKIVSLCIKEELDDEQDESVNVEADSGKRKADEIEDGKEDQEEEEKPPVKKFRTPKAPSMEEN